MEKEFVPYEQALVLKELGFDEPCFGYYEPSKEFNYLNWEIFKDLPYLAKNSEWQDLCGAPTFSQAFRWFRENYRLSVLIHDCLDDYIGEIVEWSLSEDKIIHEVPNRIETYEQVELKCLDKLIEIVESK